MHYYYLAFPRNKLVDHTDEGIENLRSHRRYAVRYSDNTLLGPTKDQYYLSREAAHPATIETRVVWDPAAQAPSPSLGPWPRERAEWANRWNKYPERPTQPTTLAKVNGSDILIIDGHSTMSFPLLQAKRSSSELMDLRDARELALQLALDGLQPTVKVIKMAVCESAGANPGDESKPCLAKHLAAELGRLPWDWRERKFAANATETPFAHIWVGGFQGTLSVREPFLNGVTLKMFQCLHCKTSLSGNQAVIFAKQANTVSMSSVNRPQPAKNHLLYFNKDGQVKKKEELHTDGLVGPKPVSKIPHATMKVTCSNCRKELSPKEIIKSGKTLADYL